MPDDIAAAARRVAARFEAARRAGHTDVALRMEEVVALLPVLDAAAAGREDAGRVERWARAICRATGNREMAWEAYTREARPGIALADAEWAAGLSRDAAVE